MIQLLRAIMVIFGWMKHCCGKPTKRVIYRKNLNSKSNPTMYGHNYCNTFY